MGISVLETDITFEIALMGTSNINFTSSFGDEWPTRGSAFCETVECETIQALLRLDNSYQLVNSVA